MKLIRRQRLTRRRHDLNSGKMMIICAFHDAWDGAFFNYLLLHDGILRCTRHGMQLEDKYKANKLVFPLSFFSLSVKAAGLSEPLFSCFELTRCQSFLNSSCVRSSFHLICLFEKSITARMINSARCQSTPPEPIVNSTFFGN